MPDRATTKMKISKKLANKSLNPTACAILNSTNLAENYKMLKNTTKNTPALRRPAIDWTGDDVQRWLDAIDMSDYRRLFGGMTGEHLFLQYTHYLSSRSSVYDSLRTMGLTFNRFYVFIGQLESLFGTQFSIVGRQGVYLMRTMEQLEPDGGKSGRGISEHTRTFAMPLDQVSSPVKYRSVLYSS